MPEIVAGVDSSTQSCTVELRDAGSGALLGTGNAKHPPTYPPVSEQRTGDWWRAFGEALARAVAAAGVDARDIRAVSVGAQCHGLVGLDRDGTPVRPVKLWNDTTAGDDVRRLLRERPQESWVSEVLLPLNPALTIAKLAWVATHEPENLARIRRLMVPADWLVFALTGEHVTDRSNASGTGYYSAHEARWRADLLGRHVSDAVDWDSLLPRVLGPQEAAGTVLPAVAEELGLSAGVVVGPGGGDQHLAAVGIGLREGEVAFSLGTSGVVLTPAGLPAGPRNWTVDYVCDTTGGYLPLVCTLNCTKVTDRFAYFLGVDLPELDELALSVREPAGPVLLPYLDGERTPMRPGATGTLAGLRSDSTREELARAAYDGVVQGLVRGAATLQELAGRPITDRVVAIGGGARSRAYRQLIADRCGAAVVTLDAPEATARGAGIQAAAVLHGATVADVRDAWSPAVASTTEPRVPGPLGLDPGFAELSDRIDDWYFGR
ncbi:MAG: xylulokinase [Propionicimonas sp.]|nr:xylulokinase [Propionicimonas sp.]